MNKILATAVLGIVAITGLIGCGDKKASPAQGGPDPVIQHYVQRRSDLLAQRRRLAATYGETSQQVADIDRQIALVDQAADQRRAQVIEDEEARQQVRRMKEEATPLPLEPAPPAASPAR